MSDLRMSINLVLNNELQSVSAHYPTNNITSTMVQSAAERLERFAPLLAYLFPELEKSQGIIESELLPLTHYSAYASKGGRFWLKGDHALAVAGSVKARGGIHEVLEIVDELSEKYCLMPNNSVIDLLSERALEVLAKYQVTVGSTGNLGMSVGIMAAALGMQATVHMSTEAKEWKKQRLRERGAQVIEHAGDYSQAVEVGRTEALADAFNHFVDDEHSISLFCGYAVAGRRLKAQLEQLQLTVNAEHPLFVYIPCGVGGAPGGIAYGLKEEFGDHVHVFFVEPEDSSCFAVQLQHLDQPGISIYDVGQQNQTEADGLAVPVASQLAVKEMRPRLSGVVVIGEDNLLRNLYLLKVQEEIQIEPSAAASLSGPQAIFDTAEGQQYPQQHGLQEYMHQANHIVWATGGSLMPDSEYQAFWKRGMALDKAYNKA
ncbi:D-serine ammonia-lyase [Oligella urethralis]|uniref:D-serine ammonia-lyase n=1 Tax=Oligella urethralis TaxID=90245 RepID=UPI0027B891B4|nr:D-serine ammonia-lyase [Oligella urethralis]